MFFITVQFFAFFFLPIFHGGGHPRTMKMMEAADNMTRTGSRYFLRKGTIKMRSMIKLGGKSSGALPAGIYFRRGERNSNPSFSWIVPIIPFGATSMTPMAITPRINRLTLG